MSDILPALVDLTHAEPAVVDRLFKGKSTREIATAKGVQDNTLRAHLKSVHGKILVRGRAGRFNAWAPTPSVKAWMLSPGSLAKAN